MSRFYITDSSDIARFYKTRDMEYPKITEIYREVKVKQVDKKRNYGKRFLQMA